MAHQDNSSEYMEFITPTILYWKNELATMDHPLPPTLSKFMYEDFIARKRPTLMKARISEQERAGARASRRWCQRGPP
jgi:hypothetical protein